MAKKKKINKSAIQKDTIKNGNGKSITHHDFEPINYDTHYGRFSFESVFHHKKCSIESWNGKEVKILIDKLKLVESLTWLQIQNHKGLDFKEESHTAIKKPDSVPQDTSLYSFKIDTKTRVFGYRIDYFFYIVFFDKNHVVCPMNKAKRYSS